MAKGLLGGNGAIELRGRGQHAGTADWSFLPDGSQGMRQGFDSPESFWAALGRPETPQGYTLPEAWSGDGVSEDMAGKVNEVLSGDREEFLQVCHHCNLTGHQAKALFGMVGQVLARGMEKEASEQEDTGQVLRRLWSGDAGKNLDAARRGAQYAGLGDELDNAGLSAHPLVLRLAKALGDVVGESGAPGSSGYRAGLPVGERAREEMHRIIASDAYRRNEPSALRKVVALAGRVDA
jgi:hypothetical protein